MISHPKPGERVRVHYNARVRAVMPHHGKLGTILFKAGGRRGRNHAVQIDGGPSVSIPAGNLRKPTWLEKARAHCKALA